MINKNLKKLLDKVEGRITLSEKFHKASNNRALSLIDIKNTALLPQEWIKIHFKTYPRLDKVSLDNLMLKDKKLGKIIRERRSVRTFSGLAITKTQLSYLLFSSCGLIKMSEAYDESRRPYPSAGARYPLEVYTVILNCNKINKGLYHYNVKENSLELLLEKNLKKWISKTVGGESWIENAAVIFIITGVLDRTQIKYGNRGYRYMLIEAGHLGQNICLLTAELGLGSCPLGGYVDSEVNKMLDINLQKEPALYIVPVGHI